VVGLKLRGGTQDRSSGATGGGIVSSLHEDICVGRNQTRVKKDEAKTEGRGEGADGRDSEHNIGHAGEATGKGMHLRKRTSSFLKRALN